jgi:hypothetical protein
MTIKLVIASLAVLGCASIAHAQDVIIEGDATIVEQAPADETVVVPDGGPGPRVYGYWTMRPADCGTFRYWNGERCADARDEPPVPN